MTQIGPYTLHTIETGRFGLDGGAMFGVVPKTLWERRLAPDAFNRVPLHMRCLLAEGDGRVILVDNGVGDKYDRRFGDIYAIDHSDNTLLGSLASAGFSPDDVTDVVLTHLHFDHAGGSTRRKGDLLVPAFSRATYHVQRSHWHWAREPNLRERASFLPENIEPLAASGQLNLVDGDQVLFPGVDVRVVNGHTEAQQLVVFSGGDRTLAFVADLLPTAAHLGLPWIMAYDVRPLVTLGEKAAFLDEALRGGWSLFFEHDATVVTGDLAAGERGVQLVNPRPLHEL